MTAKPQSYGWIHRILLIFIVITIIGEVGNVIAWWAVPASQISLNGGELNGVTSPASLLSTSVGTQNALIIGSVLLLAVAAVYAYSLWGLLKKQKQAPFIVMGVSVANRVIALFIFAISVAFAFWAVWTVILVIVAYLDWRKMKTAASA
jgi:hypothetical protein